MRKTFAITAALVLAFSTAACSSDSGDSSSNTSSGHSTSSPGGKDDGDPSATMNQSVALYLPNGNADGFVTKVVTTDGTPEHIVSMLVAEGALPEGCALKSFAIVAEGSAEVDMNSVYGEALHGVGTRGEWLRVGSLVNTLLTYFELEEITITVDGEAAGTGHGMSLESLGFHHDG
ncbi:MAG: GerMN domain-containing protein [Micrococcales bacterium]|nr:GerMN domain-containing protein [Micrococcales bacterium]